VIGNDTGPVIAALEGSVVCGETCHPRLILRSAVILGGIALPILEEQQASGARPPLRREIARDDAIRSRACAPLGNIHRCDSVQSLVTRRDAAENTGRSASNSHRRLEPQG
jgi:hypothetical protein